MAVSELSRPFAIKLPTVMKHLDVLGDAGLITRTKTGRTVAVELAAGPMEEAMQWLRRYERFWSARLDRLAAHAELLETKARAAERLDGGSMTSLTDSAPHRGPACHRVRRTDDAGRYSMLVGAGRWSRADRRDRCVRGRPFPGALSHDRRHGA